MTGLLSLIPRRAREQMEDTLYALHAVTAGTLAVVSVSGGKDSTATAIRALERFGSARCRFVWADTGHEHPLTVAYIRDYLPRRLNIQIDEVRADFSADIDRKRRYIAEKWPSKGVPAERIARALEVLHPTGVPFLDLCMMKGRFPSRIAQFCTQELKRRPLDAYMFELMAAGSRSLESWQGVRRDESRNRANALAREPAAEGWTIVRPIVDWTAAQVFELLAKCSVNPNPLYRLGCSRVGCMPCINANKGEIATIAARWPEEIARVREWERIVADAGKRGLTSFFPISGDNSEPDEVIYPQFQIDSMVEWARTSRGGKEIDPDKLAPPPECSSVYGLCE